MSFVVHSFSGPQSLDSPPNGRPALHSELTDEVCMLRDLQNCSVCFLDVLWLFNAYSCEVFEVDFTYLCLVVSFKQSPRHAFCGPAPAANDAQ